MVQFFDSAKVQNLSVKVCVYLNENGFSDRRLLRSGNFWKVILQNEIRVSRISTIQYFKNSDASIDRSIEHLFSNLCGTGFVVTQHPI